MRSLVLILLIVCGWAAMPGRAVAHTRSESFSAWLIDGPRIRLTFTISDAEAKRLSKTGEIPGDTVLIGYVAPRIGATVGGTICPQATPPRIVAAQPGFRRIEFNIRCESAVKLALRDEAFFDLIPTHVNLAQIRKADGSFVEQIFTSDVRALDLSEADGHGLESAGFFRFVSLGIMHIFTGADHQFFLLGLVLISRRLRDLVFVVTGFTLGHSLTLALAVTGILRPHAEFIDALVALTIILIGIDNVSVAIRRPVMIAAAASSLLVIMWLLRLNGIGILPPALLLGSAIFTACYLIVSGSMQDAGRLRLIVTLIFGLIHGFGFAADLLESNIPAGRLAELLVGFNLGVEIAQLTLVVGVTLLVMQLSKFRLTLPRPIVIDLAAAVLVCVGTTWFIARSFA